MQLKTLFISAVHRFKQADIPEPELEAALLLSHALKMNRTEVLLAGEGFMDKTELEKFEECFSRRLGREPLAYITGEKEFWSLDFKVSKDVLIPRPETEFLLEKTIAAIRGFPGKSADTVKILDLGTGSGIIAIILALELAAAKVTAIDYSYQALKVARHNAEKHKVAERINFINCNWFDGIVAKTEFDVVVSNPPYIAREVLAKPFGMSSASLPPEVGGFEPVLALDGGIQGLQAISRIVVEAATVLKSAGWLFIEIGADQKTEVFDIVKKTGLFNSIAIFEDYAGLPRVLQARKC